jgi:DNA-binding transcriptional regulator YiaG
MGMEAGSEDAMSVSRDILEGLQEFRDAMEGNETAKKKLTCRKVKLNLKPTPYDPELVKVTRSVLNVSQAVFAEFIGVSVNCVQAWEQGENPVTGTPARLMDEIRLHPEYWRRRILESAEQQVT